MPSRHPRGFIEPSLLASELFGPAGSVNLSRLARSVSSKIAARPQRVKHIVDDPLKSGQDCPCLVQKNLDLYWQQHSAQLKPLWDAAVKRPFTSGYEVFMKEAMTLAFRQGLLPACPSASGGYSCQFLLPSEIETPPAGHWIGKYPVPLPPIAAFDEDLHEANVDQEIQFTDRSTGIIVPWTWDFGDGSISHEQNPKHSYPNPGQYLVCLTAHGCGGDDTTCQEKTILPPPPVASFTEDVHEGPAPLEVHFTDTSTGEIDTWAWNFGDQTYSQVQHPSHQYENPGDYIVTLVVAGPGGDDRAQATKNVTAPPECLTEERIDGTSDPDDRWTQEPVDGGGLFISNGENWLLPAPGAGYATTLLWRKKPSCDAIYQVATVADYKGGPGMICCVAAGEPSPSSADCLIGGIWTDGANYRAAVILRQGGVETYPLWENFPIPTGVRAYALRVTLTAEPEEIAWELVIGTTRWNGTLPWSLQSEPFHFGLYVRSYADYDPALLSGYWLNGGF